MAMTSLSSQISPETAPWTISKPLKQIQLAEASAVPPVSSTTATDQPNEIREPFNRNINYLYVK